MVTDGGGCVYQFDPADAKTWPPNIEPGGEIADEEFPRCGHEAAEESDYCWLHRPIEERPATFDEQAAIAARIRAESDPTQLTSGPGGTVNLVGVRLSNLDWSIVVDALEATASEETDKDPLSPVFSLDIRCSSIKAAAAFDGSHVEQSINLSGAAIGQFSGRNSTFEGEIKLKQAQVRDSDEQSSGSDTDALDCSGATFAEPVRLNEATVTGSLNLGDVSSMKELQAGNLTVTGPVSFDGLRIKEAIGLQDLTCRSLSASNAELEQLKLQGSTIRRNATFDHVDFHKHGSTDDGVQLPKVTVEGNLKLSDATFHERAALNGLTVGGSLSMDGTTFGAGVNLNEADITESVTGEEIVVTDDFTCQRATFKDTIAFSRGEFNDKVTFRSTTFEGRARFDRVQFHNRAIFDYVVFRDDCDFRTTEEWGGYRAGETYVDEPAPTPEAESVEQSQQEREPEPISDGGHYSSQRRAQGVFLGPASFINTIVEGVVDVRILIESNPTETDDDLFDPTADVVTDGLTVDGDFDATGARLNNARLSGFAATGRILLDEVDLTGAKIRDGALRRASAERADFSHTNLFGVDLEGAYLHGTVFEGARIDDQTTIGKRIRYHEDALAYDKEKAKINALGKATSLYSQLETLARDNGQSRVARNMFVGRKQANEKQLKLEGNTRGWLSAWIKRLVMNYGESYFRVLITSGVLILIGAVVYPLTDLTSPGGTEVLYHGLSWDSLNSLGLALLFSISSFTALGSSGFSTGPGAGSLAVVEAGFGIIMFGVLLFVLQRRTIR